MERQKEPVHSLIMSSPAVLTGSAAAVGGQSGAAPGDDATERAELSQPTCTAIAQRTCRLATPSSRAPVTSGCCTCSLLHALMYRPIVARHQHHHHRLASCTISSTITIVWPVVSSAPLPPSSGELFHQQQHHRQQQHDDHICNVLNHTMSWTRN